MVMKMKVCMVLPPNLPMPPVKGGAIETLMQYIIDENEIEKELSITVISLWDQEAERLSAQYKLTKFVYYHWNVIDDIKWFLFRAFRKVFKINIHLLEPYEYFASKYVLKHKFDAFINESADFNAFKRVSDVIGKEKCFAHLHSEFPANRIIDSTFGTIISVSEYIKRQWLQSSKINSKDVVVLKNCVDKSRFVKRLSDIERKNMREELEISKDDFLVYFCGRIVPEKGILELINAITAINDISVKLLIIGSPNFGRKDGKNTYLDKVKSVINDNKQRVKFTGYIDNKELYKYYSISDCVVVPSTYEDPAPLVPIESLMAEKALIVTNSGGAVEYVSDDSAIMVIKEKNLSEQIAKALLEIKSNPSRKCSMENSAKRESVKYTKERYYQNFVALLKDPQCKWDKA